MRENGGVRGRMGVFEGEWRSFRGLGVFAEEVGCVRENKC